MPPTLRPAGGGSFRPGQRDVGPFVLARPHVETGRRGDGETRGRGDGEAGGREDRETRGRGDVETRGRGDVETIRYETIQCDTMLRETIRIRYGYDTITDTIQYDTIRYDTVQHATLRYDAMRHNGS